MDRSGQRLEAEGGPAGGAWSGIAGLMALCGRRHGPPLAPPPRLVTTAHRLADAIGRRSAKLGRHVRVDPMRVLVERAVANRLHRGGDVSAGGSAHLIPAADGWLAVNLARPDDWELIDAWLQPPPPLSMTAGGWEAVAHQVAGHSAAVLTSRAALLGLPVSSLGERRPDASPPDPPAAGAPGGHGLGGQGVRARCIRAASPPAALDDLLIVDLSALWAGPLTGHLLQRAGARVVKVESWSRPDGARRGPPAFFAALNGGKASVALDFTTPEGRRSLGALVGRADVVITAARPRALAQLGLDPDRLVAEGPRVWVSITGYGPSGVSADRVAFGDDAAVAGGLVVWDDRGPCFCGDAIADPLSGLAAADSVLAALEAGGRWVIDVSMADCAAGCVGTTPVADRTPPGPIGPDPFTDVGPRTEPAVPAVPPLGQDTESVLSEFGIG